MKITRRQLRQLISEAMYDPNTFPGGEDRHIPQSMIVSDNPEYREKVSTMSGGSDEYFKSAANLIDISDQMDAPAVVKMRGGYERLSSRPTLSIAYVNKDGSKFRRVEAPVSKRLFQKVKNAVRAEKAGNPSLSSAESLALCDRVVSEAERWILNNMDDVNEYYYTGASEFDWEDGAYYNPNNDLLDELIS
tara:strand:- start:861 stop:1433 length:573 start_codon:yes stop_codon:yes gene_type:complete